MPQLLTTDERQEISQSLARTDSAPAEMDDEVLKVARDLSMIHGRIRVSREESGFIRYGFDTPKLASALFGFVKSYF